MTTPIPKSTSDNLRFLIAEVGLQVADLKTCLTTSSVSESRRIMDRSGYVLNLKLQIHNSCFDTIVRHKAEDIDPQAFRSVESIATNLDSISELCRDCIQQWCSLGSKEYFRLKDYKPLFKRVIWGIDLIDRAILENNTQLALKISRVEDKLEQACEKLVKKYTAELKAKKNVEDIIPLLFVAHHVGQMGTALLKISEAVISVNLGQPVNIDRYHSLKASVEQLADNDTANDIALESIAETRSGSNISGISTANGQDDGYVAIFKDGNKSKLKEERQGVESWHEIFPGLAPKILSYHKRGQSAALLIEHLAGLTLENILLHESQQLLEEALGQLNNTLESVWRETHSKKPVSAHYMGQLKKRLEEVYGIHPEFCQGDSQICGYSVAPFDVLVEQAYNFETKIETPFAVYIHGDFNVDNIIYDAMEKKINFIDLHRSRYMDYVQDVSVFMVSNFRLQVLDAPLRRRILALTRNFYRFASGFAEKSGDKTFDLRLALGLARSFATSTRFILDKSLAKTMFMRSRFLIEQIVTMDLKKRDHYRVPIEEIFVG